MRLIGYFFACTNSGSCSIIGGMQKLSLSSTQTKKVTKKPGKKGFLPWWGWLLTAVVSILIIVGVAGGIIAYSSLQSVRAFQAQATNTYAKAREAYDTFKQQDLEGTKAKIEETKASFATTKEYFADLRSPLTLLGYRQYYEDGLVAMAAADEGLDLASEMIKIMEPAAEMLGFTKEDKSEDGTTEDRVKKLLDTLQLIGPQGMATHSSVLAWTDEPGGLQSVGSQRVGHN